MPLPMFPASVEAWRSLMEQYAGDLPVNFLLAWLKTESDGNECSYTTLRESGIWQLMPPDNTNTAGTTEAELRVNCSGQRRTRPLTNTEAVRQIATGIRYVNAMRDVARRKLRAAGVTWSEDGPDFWRFVKLQHAYPGPSAGWLAQATARYLRPPKTWAEMRSVVPGFQGVLDNAEKVGAYGGGTGSGMLFLGLLAAAAGFGTVYYITRSKHA